MTYLDTEAGQEKIGAGWRVPSIDELVDTLERHLTARVSTLNDRLQSAAMSAIRNGRTTMCEYPSIEPAMAPHGPKVAVEVERHLYLVAAE